MNRRWGTGASILLTCFVGILLAQPVYAGDLQVKVLPPPGVPNFSFIGTVVRFDEANATPWENFPFQTEKDGTLVVNQVRPGHWNITVSNENYYGSVVKSGVDMPAGTAAVPITVQLPVSKSSKIFGYVWYSHSQGSMWTQYPPMPTLTVENKANGKKMELRFAQGDGYFFIDGVPAPGTYVFRATHKTMGEAQDTVTVQPGQIRRLELITQLPPPPPDPGYRLGGVNGRVTGKPPSGQSLDDLKNIEVTVVGTQYKALTDGKGYYKIPAVIPLGTYDLVARKGNWVGTMKAVKLDMGKLIQFVDTIELKPEAPPSPVPAKPGGRGIRGGKGGVGG
jgi:hypothetical protein